MFGPEGLLISCALSSKASLVGAWAIALLSKASLVGAWATGSCPRHLRPELGQFFFHYVYVVQGISRGSLGYCVVVQGISRGSLGDEFLSKASPIGAWAEEWEGGVKKYSSEFVYRA